jgi:drug/metabolite transporter (DMT)-like permease
MVRMQSFPLDDGRKATFAAGVTVFFWASAFVAIRAAGRQYDPGALALGRLGVATLVLLPVLAIRREGLPARKAWPGIVASGLLWFGLYMVALNQGERLVDAGTAAMLVNVAPILTVLLAGWLLKEGVTRNVLLGLAVAFLGTILVGLATGGARNATSWGGVWLCLLAALCYALGMVLQKPALRHASSLQVTTFSCLVGALACLPFSGQLWAQASRAPLAATANIVYLGVFPTALGFLTWGYALSRTHTAKLAVTTYVVPFLVILLSWALLGEVPSAFAVLGGVLCVSGVALARSRRAQPPVSSPGPDCSGSTRCMSAPVD